MPPARGLVLALVLLGLAAAPGRAAERVPVRVGDHATHGRIVFDWPRAPGYTVEERGSRAILRFAEPGEIDLSGARRLPRNILAVERVEGGVALTLREGARLRHFRNGPKVAFDALDPSAAGDAAHPAPRLGGAGARPPGLAAEAPPAAPAGAPAPAPPPGRPAQSSAAAGTTPALAAQAAGAAPRLAAPSSPPGQATATRQTAPGAAAEQAGQPAVQRGPAPQVGSDRASQAAGQPASRRGPAPATINATPPTAAAPAPPAPASAPHQPSTATPAAARDAAAAALPSQAARSPRPPAPAEAATPVPVVRASGEPAPAPRAVARADAPAAPPARPPQPPAVSAAEAAGNATAGGVAPRPVSGLGTGPSAAASTAPRQLAIAPPAADPAEAPVRPRPLPGNAVTIRFPFGQPTAAAAFLRGESLILAFDADRPLDLAAFRNDPVLSRAEAHRVAGGSVLVLPALGGELRRDGQDWLLLLGPRAPSGRTLAPAPSAAFADIPAERPGRVLAWADPLTGLPLLIGTVGEAQQRQIVARGFAGFELPETLLGVAVLARADRVALRTATGRFLLSVEGGTALARVAPPGAAEAAGLSRSFDFPSLPVPALLERLRAQHAAVAGAAPLARGAPRLAAAETLIALGLPQEALAMLRLAAQEDPLSQQDRRHGALSGIAALLAGRPGEVPASFEAGLPATDETLLWRAVRDAAAGDPRRAAPALAATAPLVLGYPDGLRRRLLPVVAEAMAEGGEHAAARAFIVSVREEAPLALALGIAEEAAGNTEAALAAFEVAAQGRDRLLRARALRRAAELRLAAGRTDPAGAARALEQTLFAWRGDEQEVALRSRIAELRRAAGDPRGALALLRETEALFADQAPALRQPIEESFVAALDAAPPLQAVALYDSHRELMPRGERGDAALTSLADRLVALDLPDRAAALIWQAMEQAPPGAHRAGLGLRLARMRLAERDAGGALAALSASGAPGLPASLLQARAVAAAQAEARRGNLALAVEALAGLGAAGDEALAEILAQTRDFAGAAAALGRHLAATLPPEPEPLDEARQRAVLRLAAMQALAGDEAALRRLRREIGARLSHRPVATAFEALSSDPVRGLADLPRMIRELELFRALPASREPLRTASAPAG